MSLVQFRPEAYADLAHLVERNLAKVEVAGSSPVIRLLQLSDVLSYIAFFVVLRKTGGDVAERTSPVLFSSICESLFFGSEK